jgi:ribosome-associated protein
MSSFYPVVVSRVPTEIRITERVRVPGAEVSLSFARSGGPGGQHVNRTETKVLLRWNAIASGALTPEDRSWLLQRLGSRLTSEGELLITSETHRDQRQNVEEALRRFADVVRAAIHRPVPRKKTRPSRGSKERRLSAKRRRGGIKRDRRAGED